MLSYPKTTDKLDYSTTIRIQDSINSGVLQDYSSDSRLFQDWWNARLF